MVLSLGMTADDILLFQSANIFITVISFDPDQSLRDGHSYISVRMPIRDRKQRLRETK